MTEKQIQKLQQEGKIRGYKVTGSPDKPENKSKYNNKRVEWNGIKFDSIKEKNRYAELLLLERSGHIINLKRQVRFELVPKQEGKRAMCYKADFCYTDTITKEYVVEDVKSEFTKKLRTYIDKKKLMLKVHGINIKEV